MYIKEFKDFDSDSGEADVIVTDGLHELMCYCHPINNTKVGTIVEKVSTLFAENIMRVDSQKYLIKKESEHYAYLLQGKVLSCDEPLIGIGELIVELDKPLPKDIKQGEFVELEVYRLDCVV